jgi:hypothetical protein
MDVEVGGGQDGQAGGRQGQARIEPLGYATLPPANARYTLDLYPAPLSLLQALVRALGGIA